MKKLLQPVLNLALILVYIVVIAGSVVRMTGSGMGCPDWPKCFGYLVPPTEESELEWKAEHHYEKGQVIIRNKELRVVKDNFTSGENFNANHWEAYTKHDYAKFNPVHTWIEYINRLATVLFGFPILLLVACGIAYFKENKTILLLALAALFSVGFEAWLGKLVVDANLLPVKVTLHVLFVFFIIAFLIGLKYVSLPKTTLQYTGSKLNWIGVLVLVLTLIQVIMGTQVRQHVDIQMIENGYTNQSTWLNDAPLIFFIHRSFSILLLVANGYWIFLTLQLAPFFSFIKWPAIFLGFEMLSGIILYYLDFPFLSQPTHLLLSSLIFGAQLYSVLSLWKKKT